MDDKEIGNLWKVNQFPILNADELHNTQTAAIFLLIIKLVQDRYCVYDLQGHPDPLAKALREFGIDYQDYLTVKEAIKT